MTLPPQGGLAACRQYTRPSGHASTARVLSGTPVSSIRESLRGFAGLPVFVGLPFVVASAAAAEVCRVEPEVGTHFDGDYVVDFDVERVDGPFVEAVLAQGVFVDVLVAELAPRRVVA